MGALSVVEDLDVLEDVSASDRVRFVGETADEFAKKLSATALSQQFPLRLMLWRMR